MNVEKNRNLAVNKLILLYVSSKMPAGVEHDEIVRLNMDGSWMLYFDMEQYLLELYEDTLLDLLESNGRKLYTVTAEGLNVLGLLKTSIPFSIRAAIDEKMADHKSVMELEQEITADYTQDTLHEYPVVLRITENRQAIFEMHVTAPSAEAAQLVCTRFRADAADIYAGIIERLTRESTN